MGLRESIVSFITAIGDYALLVCEVFASFLVKPPRWKLIKEQLYQIGVLSLPVVAISGFTTGIVLAAQSFYQLADKGLTCVTGALVAKAMIAELGPVLTAIMITGRIGSAMCAELGSMRVTEQIDALRSMAIHPIKFLVAPRFAAALIMVPLLTIFSMVMGIWGGYLISVYLFDLTPRAYFEPMHAHLSGFDFFTGVAKAVAFGMLIITLCCYQGLKTRGGAAGVGRATTRSVVISYVSILVCDFLLTMALNHFHQSSLKAWWR